MKGVCRSSVVPVRKEPNDRSEMVSQLLFGDHYAIEDVTADEKWGLARIEYDNYKGWIDMKQHFQISDEFFTQINNSDFKVCIDLTSRILYNHRPLVIVMGSILPISSFELFEIGEHFAFNGESKSLGAKTNVEYLLEVAEKYLHCPYLWGGKTPFGIDCSGFVQMVFKICGYRLPRDTVDQVRLGTEVSDFRELRAGDVAYFGKDGTISHVGIAMGEGRIIHASGHVKIESITEEGIVDDLKHITHPLIKIKRLIHSV